MKRRDQDLFDQLGSYQALLERKPEQAALVIQQTARLLPDKQNRNYRNKPAQLRGGRS